MSKSTNIGIVLAFVGLVAITATAYNYGNDTTNNATQSVNGSISPPLEKDPPSANASETVQMTIRPGFIAAVPNGTAIMSMTGTNDIDFRGNPDKGVTVIITNDTATVTNHPVDIKLNTPPAPAAGPATAPAATGAGSSGGGGSSGDSGGSSGGDGGGDE